MTALTHALVKVRPKSPTTTSSLARPTPQRCGAKPCPPSGRRGHDDVTLMRRGGSTSTGMIPPVVKEVLGSPGDHLPSATRATFELSFGHDFGNVRVHSDQLAARSAEAVEAEAYTVGTHIVFGADRFHPESTSGQRLLMHELTHVVQQSESSGPPTTVAVVEPSGSRLEVEAARAEGVLGSFMGEPARPAQRSGGRLLRQPANSAAGASGSGTPQSAPPTNPPPKNNLSFSGDPSILGTFDAILDRGRCLLTIRKKLWFQFLDQPPANQWGAGYVPWPPGAADRFTRDFMRLVTDRWSFRYALAPTAPCAAESCRAVTAAVQVVPVGEGEQHTTVQVGYSTGQ
ncbi:MAG TPA: DUF4157 domain-containing protein, partial [Actinomycetota bacterium]|nr:DUF4157 domain-containing protein [Actinomycetota bacterium]